MKTICHSVSLALVVILVFGTVAITSVAAREYDSVEEIRLTADNPVADAQFGRPWPWQGISWL